MQHYTNQLAKDSSKQLKELHDYSAEDALDPRYDIALRRSMYAYRTAMFISKNGKRKSGGCISHHDFSMFVCRQWKLQRERLQSDFTRALDNFQRAQRSAAQKEKDAIKKFRTTEVSQSGY